MTTDLAAVLTEDEVRDVIETFWRLDAGKAHLADFLPIMDDEFVIRAVDDTGAEVVRFDGLAGLEDHQDGKMDIFDEAFELTALRLDPGAVTAAPPAPGGTPRPRVEPVERNGVG